MDKNVTDSGEREPQNCSAKIETGNFGVILVSDSEPAEHSTQHMLEALVQSPTESSIRDSMHSWDNMLRERPRTPIGLPEIGTTSEEELFGSLAK